MLLLHLLNVNPKRMSYIDIIIGILLLLAAINGFRKGFVVEVASLAALILGIWGAIRFSYITSDFMVENFNITSRHLGVISFIITFILIVILVHLVGKVADSFIKAAQLGFINRLAGLFFGFIKSALILSIVLMVIDTIDENVHIIPQKAKENSRVYEPVKMLVPTIFPFVKFWTEKAIQDKKEEKKETTSGQVVT